MSGNELELIKQLKAKYCYFVDDYFKDPANLDRLINEVFHEDSAVDFGAFGQAQGGAEIRNWFLNVCYQSLSFCMHMVHNPIIKIKNELKAEGRWYFLVPCTWRATNNAMWLGGVYDEEYEKIAGAWRIKSLKVHWIFGTPFDKGWVKEDITKVNQ